VHVVDPIPPHQEFRAIMLTAGHTNLNYLYSSHGRNGVKPPLGLDGAPVCLNSSEIHLSFA
jgi:hypothetical protein